MQVALLHLMDDSERLASARHTRNVELWVDVHVHELS